MDRGLIDAAEFNNPVLRPPLGFPDVAKFYMMGSHHQQAECFRGHLQQGKFDALRRSQGDLAQRRPCGLIRPALHGVDRYPKDLEEIKKRGVNVFHTAEAVLNAQLKAWDQVLRRADRRSRSSRR